MAFDRRNSGGCARIFIVLLIAVFGFIAFQALGIQLPFFNNQQPSGPIATATSDNSLAQAATKAVPVINGTPLVSGTPSLDYRIVAEKANLETLITEVYFGNNGEWDLTYLRDLAGHLEGTPQFGRGGNFVLAGHVELEGGVQGPFRNLKNLKLGDLITILSAKGNNPTVMRYSVTEIKDVAPNDLSVIRSHGYEELTLLTCDNFNFSTNEYETRVIVHARPVEDSALFTLPPTATPPMSSLPGSN